MLTVLQLGPWHYYRLTVWNGLGSTSVICIVYSVSFVLHANMFTQLFMILFSEKQVDWMIGIWLWACCNMPPPCINIHWVCTWFLYRFCQLWFKLLHMYNCTVHTRENDSEFNMTDFKWHCRTFTSHPVTDLDAKSLLFYHCMENNACSYNTWAQYNSSTL